MRLCGDDRLCHECDVENERNLREIRAKQSADASTADNASKSRGARRVIIENEVKPAGGACGESDSNRRSSKSKQNPKKSSSSLSEAEGDSSGVPAHAV